MIYFYFSITGDIQYYFVLVSGINIVVRQSYTLHSVPPIFSVPGSINNYYNIINSISYAVLYIPMTIL